MFSECRWCIQNYKLRHIPRGTKAWLEQLLYEAITAIICRILGKQKTPVCPTIQLDSVVVKALETPSPDPGFSSHPLHFRIRSWTGRDAYTHVTKQYRPTLVLEKKRWCYEDGKVTVSLASHWPHRQSSSAYKRDISTTLSVLLPYGTFYLDGALTEIWTPRGHSGWRNCDNVEWGFAWAWAEWRRELIKSLWHFGVSP